MKEIFFYLLTFVIIFLFYLFFVILRKKKLEKFRNNMYVEYLAKVYKIDVERIDIRSLALTISLINSFIIATTVFILGFIDNMILKFLSALVVLIPLQLFMYHIVGKIFEKRFKEEK